MNRVGDHIVRFEEPKEGASASVDTRGDGKFGRPSKSLLMWTVP